MNLFRLLVIVAIVWLSYRIYQNWKVSKQISTKKTDNDTGIKQMVQCAKCGVHLPEQEAINASGNYYCCEEHKN